MKIIIPTKITDEVLASSTVPEEDHDEWIAAADYAVGDKVMVLVDHAIYEAIAAGKGNIPSSSPESWLRLGRTNRWRMFEDKIGTKTTALEEITVELTPGIATALALLDISAAHVQVTMTDPVEGAVYDHQAEMYDPLGIVDYYSYFFEPIRRRSTVILHGFPSYAGAIMTVSARDGAGKAVSIGAMIVGKMRSYAPAVEYGANVGIMDYSRKERDQWGDFIVVERAFSRRAQLNFTVRSSDIDQLYRELSALRATPAVYIGSKYESTVVFGFYRDFDIVISYPTHSECSIELEGLT
ncbi:MAG: hypothetical protein RBR06_06050 [Desulfuromonadaceae bacterium]|nr:hypothetical protein [Desulfuromonadaceae bacterium]